MKMRPRYSVIASAVSLGFVLSKSVMALGRPDTGSLNRELEQRQIQSEAKPSGELFNQTANSPYTAQYKQGLKFPLKQVQILDRNNQEVVTDELAHILKNYVGKEVSLSDLSNLANEISEFYRHNNYLVAKAILPPQEIEQGTVKILLLKGNVGEIRLQNHSALSNKFVSRLSNTTVNTSEFILKDELEKFALTINDVPGVNAGLQLSAGKKVGEANLLIKINDAKRFSGYVSVDNQGNKYTGRYRLAAGTKVNNLTGWGDELKLDLLSSNQANLKNARIDYSSLIDGYSTRFGVTANYLHYKLGGNFKSLQSQGHSHNLGAYLLHPTIRTPNFRLSTKVSFNHQNLTDAQQAVTVKQKRKINSLTVGVDGSWNLIKDGTTYFSLSTLFGNLANQTNETKHNAAEDFQSKSHFTVYNYRLSHEQILPKSFAFNIGINGQFADKNLESSQKMLLGGLSGVRGHQAGAASVDEGHVIQTEFKHYLPVFSQSVLVSSLFYDYGFGKSYKHSQFLEKGVKNSVKLQSVGAGLSFSDAGSYAINASIAKPLDNNINNADKHQFWLSMIKTF
ncbi:TPA: heme/hemopexin-binding protein HxuB [Haemophilus influenzae]|uniref:heme/hemopexin-binding protein HxuB n=1 Tax=Haemophilus influenzae TaxID=727 RepID=UPI000D00CA9C|nr:heme/hemopexin-binding protein HxuB [Haemophilus influenzae]MCK9655078.1 heme/hemopexin-binding protein HxuB [Haemophilus influenzae]PRI33993.1 Heme/hemopexin transporter protein HuxB precursor [Haemophilus influenzae]PRI36455.1 Heme/hemopexin transporter protein HuxB precursor [Haemophilus influenzae]PRM54549.1 Heme/hemopexin transporter protein HuxB precursor [Haemophilus influenzae]PRM60192.1 Heme/hemopexin transporter protein HuxB precursor [Haemophilus influenzae]